MHNGNVKTKLRRKSVNTNRTSFDDTILILVITYERKTKRNEILKMNILSYQHFLLWQTLRKLVQ